MKRRDSNLLLVLFPLFAPRKVLHIYSAFADQMCRTVYISPLIWLTVPLAFEIRSPFRGMCYLSFGIYLITNLYLMITHNVYKGRYKEV